MWGKGNRTMENTKRPGKEDLRVIKTKKAIRQTFTDLMSRKPLEEITVSDIAVGAMINRKTFYAHYASIYDIVSEIEDEIVSSFQQMLEGKRFEDILENPYGLFHGLVQTIDNNIDLYGRLLTVSGTSNLVQKIIQMIRQHVFLTYKDESPVEPKTLDMAVCFLLSGLLAVFTEWYNSGRTQPVEEISEQLSLLCIDGMNGIIKANQTGGC